MLYQYGKYTIESNLLLSPLAPVEAQVKSSDFVFKLCSHPSPLDNNVKWFHNYTFQDQTVFLSLGKNAHYYFLKFPEASVFTFQPHQNQIVCYTSENISERTISHLLLDQVMPRILYTTGHSIVHASAVIIDKQVVLFIGDSGRGKSTLALSFDREGYPVLSDDTILIADKDDGFVAQVLYRGFRVWSDTAKSLIGIQDTVDLVSQYNSKQRLIASTQSELPSQFPIGAAFLITEPVTKSNEIRIAEIPPSESVMTLVQSSFRLDMTDKALLAKEFDTFTNFVHQTPFYTLSYPRDYSRLPEVHKAILAVVSNNPNKTENID